MADWPTIPDASGNAIPGTATNMEQADIALDTPGGTFARKSFAFGGTDEFITMGDVLGFDRFDAQSWQFWFKTTATTTNYLLTKIGSGVGFGINVRGAPDAGTIAIFLRKVYVSDDIVIRSSVAHNTGSWVHCVITWSGATGLAADCKMYFNGVEDTTKVVVRNVLTGSIANSDDFMLGDQFGAPVLPFVGSMSEPAVYPGVLSAGEVASIYNAGVPAELPGGARAWWRADAVSWPQSAIPAGDIAPIAREEDGHERSLVGVIAPAPPVQYYQMRGIDSTCPAIQQPAYVFWTVVGTPDYTAAQLSPSALPCGSDPLTDVVDIQIAGDWQIVPE